jgi:hypothetical protein
MNNFKNELKYQWRMLKANVKGGYQEVKKLLVYEDLVEKFKEGLRIIKEDNEYEKQQKMYHKKEILQPNDIVEFRDPNCLGNIIKGRVIDVRYEFVMGEIEIQIEVLENCLRNKRDVMFVYQHHILNNLINIEQPNINK